MPAESYFDAIDKIDLDAITDKLEGVPGFARDMARSRQQVAALARLMFESEYRPVIEWLIDITLRRPVFLPGLGTEALSYAAHREGGNAVVWQLLQAIAEGREEQPPAREGV